MISNNHELTIGELDCVSGGMTGLGGTPGAQTGPMAILQQIMQALQPPKEDFQQLMNDLNTRGQG